MHLCSYSLFAIGALQMSDGDDDTAINLYVTLHVITLAGQTDRKPSQRTGKP